MKGFGNRNGALIIAAMARLGALGGQTLTATRTHQEPDNRGRRAEKSAERLAKADEKRKRRAAKRLGHNAPGKPTAANEPNEG